MLGCLRQFFVDDTGQYSCMRLSVLLVNMAVLGLWIWGNIRAGQYVPLGWAEAGLLGAANGSKSVQAGFEYGSWSRSGSGATPRTEESA